MRRMRLFLMLPLLLVLSQQGAWLHELGHIAYAAKAHPVSVLQSDAAFENGVCPSCQSFGQLGAAIATSLTAAPPELSRYCPQATAHHPPPIGTLPTPRNRGPPRLG